MEKGIIFSKDIEKAFQKKTGLDQKVVQANIKYINKRLKEFMEMEDVHSVRLSGFCIIDENYNFLKRRSYKNKSLQYYNILRKKTENLKSAVDSSSKEIQIPFILRPPFLYRRKYKLTDEELEQHQNEQ